jgi:hypothetical protein
MGCSPHSQHGGIALRLIGCGSYIQEKKQWSGYRKARRN